MKRSITQKQFRWTFYLWIAIGGLFWIRPSLIGKSEFTKNLRLYQLGFEGRQAQVYGNNLFRFLEFCKTHLPPGAPYALVGLEYPNLECARAVYYLYPCLLSKTPEYLLVYRQPQFHTNHFERIASLDAESFILKHHVDKP
jgi:hypothetical protein